MIHLAFSLLLAAVSFDLDMSKQDQKKTGLDKLSKEEKIALQSWVNNALGYQPAKKNPSLSENLNSGAYLKLTDNSIWNVRPEDRLISQSWISEVEILVAPSQDPEYPYKLTNSVSKSSVLAKKAPSVPKSSQK